MATYKTKGIILKRCNLGESDRILIVYTEKYGKISTIAKGARKPLSKLGGHLELFYLTDFIFAEGKKIATITSAEVIEDFGNIRKDNGKIRKAFYVAELMCTLIKESEPSEDIFKTLYFVLKILNELKGNDNIILPWFILRLLARLGHEPEVMVCAKCRKALDGKVNYFSNNLGGVICRDCYKYDLTGKIISPNTIKLIRLLADINFLSEQKIKTSQNIFFETYNVMHSFAEFIAEKKINSAKFLEQGGCLWKTKNC